MPKIALQRTSGRVVQRLEMAHPPAAINQAGDTYKFQFVAPSGVWVYAQQRGAGARRQLGALKQAIDKGVRVTER